MFWPSPLVYKQGGRHNLTLIQHNKNQLNTNPPQHQHTNKQHINTNINLLNFFEFMCKQSLFYVVRRSTRRNQSPMQEKPGEPAPTGNNLHLTHFQGFVGSAGFGSVAGREAVSGGWVPADLALAGSWKYRLQLGVRYDVMRGFTSNGLFFP